MRVIRHTHDDSYRLFLHFKNANRTIFVPHRVNDSEKLNYKALEDFFDLKFVY